MPDQVTPGAGTGANPPVKFHETTLGKIFIGVTIAVISGLAGWIGTLIVSKPSPPIAKVRPDALEVLRNEAVDFSSAESTAGSSEIFEEKWTIGALPPAESATANCSQSEKLLRCRFLLPGTVAVGLEVTDENGLSSSAVSVIQVRFPGGYMGIEMEEGDEQALQALAYDIDWQYLQSLLGIPIVLIDPATGSPAYAVQIDRPETEEEPPPWSGGAAGRKVLLGSMKYEVAEAFEMAFADIGASIIRLPFAEIAVALERGVADVAVRPVDSLQAVTNLQ
ncbi:hypothetical protein [Fulvimarina sp. MAC8]|uniref:hypothetical protein n=1 Tax=Fulvimarina sp. MAC8 TaxID=3162874 RepID=UPI0032EC1517